MSELILDITAARGALQAMSEETDTQRHRHAAGSPDFPVSAAGAGFEAQGAMLRDLLSRVHRVGTQRLEAVAATAVAATQQVEVYRAADEDFAGGLGSRA
ncbi:hypothetical protein [Corynebacterium sp. A21]|uniref:hypothetical protein n=1 Tax=Corynebacterium sp. A21 TaxID=3457318 RepID=UPI003FD22034